MKKCLLIFFILFLLIGCSSDYYDDVNDDGGYEENVDKGYVTDDVYEENADEIFLIVTGQWDMLEGDNERNPILVGEWEHYGTYAGGEFFPAIDGWGIMYGFYIFNADGSGQRPYYSWNADNSGFVLDGTETFYWFTRPGVRTYDEENFIAYGELLLKDADGEPLTTPRGSSIAYSYFISEDGLLSLRAWYAMGETPVFRRVQ